MKSQHLVVLLAWSMGACAEAPEDLAPSPGDREATATSSAAAVRVPASEQWDAMSLGGDHSCALAIDGSIWCWGRNDRGQLGNGTTVSSNKPVKIATPPGLTWVSLESGWDHACARSSSGQLYCWGHNSFGAVGNGATTNALTPIPIAGMNNLLSVGAGGSTTCVVKSDRTLWCWGLNNHSQLGDGTVVNATSPVQIGTATDWATVEPGSGHTCATKTDKTVHCWGNNFYGEIGVGAVTSPNEAAITQVPGLSGVDSLASFFAANCSLTGAGVVHCWGYNALGQVGNGQTSDVLSPTQITLASKPQQLSAGSGHACALVQRGRVLCWGNNAHGQLGIGSVGGVFPSPTLASEIEITAIAAGGLHTCALIANKAIRCWGHNWAGQLGDGTNTLSGSSVTLVARP